MITHASTCVFATAALRSPTSWPPPFYLFFSHGRGGLCTVPSWRADGGRASGAIRVLIPATVRRRSCAGRAGNFMTVKSESHSSAVSCSIDGRWRFSYLVQENSPVTTTHTCCCGRVKTSIKCEKQFKSLPFDTYNGLSRTSAVFVIF